MVFYRMYPQLQSTAKSAAVLSQCVKLYMVRVQNCVIYLDCNLRNSVEILTTIRHTSVHLPELSLNGVHFCCKLVTFHIWYLHNFVSL